MVGERGVCLPGFISLATLSSTKQLILKKRKKKEILQNGGPKDRVDKYRVNRLKKNSVKTEAEL